MQHQIECAKHLLPSITTSNGGGVQCTPMQLCAEPHYNYYTHDTYMHNYILVETWKKINYDNFGKFCSTSKAKIKP